MKSLKFALLPLMFISFTTNSKAQQKDTVEKQVLLMNRIGPSAAELFVANIDGTGEHPLLSKTGFDWKLISFTRKHEGNNFDIYTIKPDGTDLHQLTTSPANDAHAFWTSDSKHLMWSSGIYGFKDEAAIYDNTFQPYGAIFIMNADGTGKRQLTDSPWEDSMPVFAPKYSKNK